MQAEANSSKQNEPLKKWNDLIVTVSHKPESKRKHSHSASEVQTDYLATVFGSN